MRTVLVILLSGVLAACESVPEPAMARRFQPVAAPMSPIERDVLTRFQRLASINAAIDDRILTFLTSGEVEINFYRQTIQERYDADFRAIYRRNDRRADDVYLLLATDGESHIVFAIPVRRLDHDKLFEIGEGLVYQFSGSSAEVRSVTPSDY
ncbi:MAG: hypothetical protein AB7F85_09920 [Hyphomonadaceae bacterium]